ncbi:MAG: DUF3261 domain-containing protein [Kiritimatiellaeota bacterium]|nr:DUF3261 domain-containing protein [Kiritimatiellota bacterium]
MRELRFRAKPRDIRGIRVLAAAVLAVACVALVVGCATISFPEPVFAKFAATPDPAEVLASFRSLWPVRFTERQTALIYTPRGKIATIGVCSFDKRAGDFALALMTPAGFKLLQIQKHCDKTTSVFRIPGVSPSDKAANQMADDAWLIYAHPDGPPSIREIRGDRVILTWRDGGETVEMVFGRSPGATVLDLKTKRVVVDGRDERTIHYYEYRGFPDGTRRPSKIAYENSRHDYRLTIKTIAAQDKK